MLVNRDHAPRVEEVGGLCRLPRPERHPFGSIRVIERTFDPVVADGLAALDFSNAPDLRLVADVDEVAATVRDRLPGVLPAPAWLAGWLVHDIDFLARIFRRTVAADRVVVRLETVSDDACRRFHVDNLRFRLITTYRGPGTEWLDPEVPMVPADGGAPGVVRRRLSTGHVGVMRGGMAATPSCPALPHRSPPIAGRGISRLVLVIDDARDHPHPADGVR